MRIRTAIALLTVITAWFSLAGCDILDALLGLDSNEPPTVEIVEGDMLVANGEPVTLTARASDPDGDTISFLWYVDGALRSGQTGASFTTSFTPTSFSLYEIIVEVWDGEYTVTASVTVTVAAPVPDPVAPTVEITGGDRSLANGASWTFATTVTDPDSASHTFAWYLDGTLTAETGASFTFSQSPAEETLYTLRVVATDDDSLTGEDAVTVTVAAPDPLLDGLVAHYELDGDGTDSTAYANTASVSGATTASDRFGNSGAALSLDGVNDYLFIPAATQTGFATNDFAISFWVKNADDIAYLYDARTGSEWGPSLATGSDARIAFVTQDGTVSGASQTERLTVGESSSIKDDAWHLVTTTRSANRLFLYFDGTLVSENPESDPLSNLGTGKPINFGRRFTSTTATGYYAGLLDDIRIYNRALTAGEVADLFSRGGWIDTQPTDLAATAGDGGITLDWSAPADTSYSAYRVVRRDDRYPAGPDDGVTQDTTLTTFTDSGLAGDTRYYYAVYAANGSLVYGTKSWASATAPGGTPAISFVDDFSTDPAARWTYYVGDDNTTYPTWNSTAETLVLRSTGYGGCFADATIMTPSGITADTALSLDFLPATTTLSSHAYINVYFMYYTSEASTVATAHAIYRYTNNTTTYDAVTPTTAVWGVVRFPAFNGATWVSFSENIYSPLASTTITSIAPANVRKLVIRIHTRNGWSAGAGQVQATFDNVNLSE